MMQHRNRYIVILTQQDEGGRQEVLKTNDMTLS